MRRIEVQRNYDRLGGDQDISPLQTISIERHSHLGHVTARMAPGITVLCGVSGVGKSQFLNVLAAHLQGRDTGDVSVVVQGRDVRGRRLVHDHGAVIAHSPTTVRCFHVDTSSECYDTISQIARTEGLEEKRAAVDMTPLRKEWAERLGYVLGRDYDQVSFQELDRVGAYGDESAPWHYYELTYRAVAYGPHQMSLGELAASVVLRVLRSTQRGDIVLLDEPENFLSPRARQRLLDVIVQQALDKSLSVVAVSHSAEIIRRLPSASLRTIEQGSAGAIIAEAEFPSQVTRAVGLDRRPDAILLVEDEFARRLLKAILVRLLPSVHLDLEIVPGQGDGDVTGTARLLWGQNIGVRMLGVLDGDRRNAPECQQEYLSFLPGDTCPEDVVLSILGRSTSEAAAGLGVVEHELDKAVRAAEGADIHDRPGLVCEVIGVEVSELISYAARWLVGSPDYQEDLNLLVARVRGIAAAEQHDSD